MEPNRSSSPPHTMELNATNATFLAVPDFNQSVQTPVNLEFLNLSRFWVQRASPNFFRFAYAPPPPPHPTRLDGRQQLMNDGGVFRRSIIVGPNVSLRITANRIGRMRLTRSRHLIDGIVAGDLLTGSDYCITVRILSGCC